MDKIKRKGFLICLEGIDGCGKTTQANLLVERLRKKGYDTLYTAEPSCLEIGSFIKKFCLYRAQRISSVVESLLFAADRFEHLNRVIIPELEKGVVVVVDRYVYSSFAYQGSTGLDLKWIETVNQFVVVPDLTLFIDVEPELVINRLKITKSVMETLENQQRVRRIYQNFVKKGQLIQIDGSKTIGELSTTLKELTLRLLSRAKVPLKTDN